MFNGGGRVGAFAQSPTGEFPDSVWGGRVKEAFVVLSFGTFDSLLEALMVESVDMMGVDLVFVVGG